MLRINNQPFVVAFQRKIILCQKVKLIERFCPVHAQFWLLAISYKRCWPVVKICFDTYSIVKLSLTWTLHWRQYWRILPVQCNLTPSPKAGLSLESLHQLKEKILISLSFLHALRVWYFFINRSAVKLRVRDCKCCWKEWRVCKFRTEKELLNY